MKGYFILESTLLLVTMICGSICRYLRINAHTCPFIIVHYNRSSNIPTELGMSMCNVHSQSYTLTHSSLHSNVLHCTQVWSCHLLFIPCSHTHIPPPFSPSSQLAPGLSAHLWGHIGNNNCLGDYAHT